MSIYMGKVWRRGQGVGHVDAQADPPNDIVTRQRVDQATYESQSDRALFNESVRLHHATLTIRVSKSVCGLCNEVVQLLRSHGIPCKLGFKKT